MSKEGHFLLDTHLALWATFEPHQISPATTDLLSDTGNTLYFSVITIWEVAIKFNRNKPDFIINPNVLREALLKNGLQEVPVRGAHTLATVDLPPIHKDPFDRLLLAQAIVENLTLLTADRNLLAYPGPILAA